MEVMCYSCGGTGDAMNHETKLWVTPREDCPACHGTGEVDYCKQNGHSPNRTGHCTICGYEVVTEVDEDGTPELD